MIDNARALRDQALSRLDTIAVEADHLLTVVEALNSLIAATEQPSADPSDRQGGAPSVAPVPARKDPPAVSTNGAAARDAKLIAAGPYPCAGCGREFSRPQGLGRHRPNCPNTKPTEVPPTPPKTDHPSRSEKFLCSRNCGASFLSRQGLNDHEAEGTCRPKQTPPPSEMAPLGTLSFSGPTRSGGFGQ